MKDLERSTRIRRELARVVADAATLDGHALTTALDRMVTSLAATALDALDRLGEDSEHAVRIAEHALAEWQRARGSPFDEAG
jgi:hypothetical protein